jgi:hypothetical protein
MSRELTTVKAIAWPLISIGVRSIAMKRRFARNLGAHCAMVAMLFGQFALAAYGCAEAGPVTPITGAHAAMHFEAGTTPCPTMASTSDAPQANACEVHCNDSVTLPGQPDWPPVTLAPLPVPSLALAQLDTVDGAPRAPLAPQSGAPPPSLRFCRLLI